MKKLIYLFPLLCALLVVGPIEAKKKKYPNGDIYEGKWENGAPNGHGIMKYANGDIYEGPWLDGIRQGFFGVMKFMDGSIYEGGWENDKPSGNGNMKYANGDSYKGYWLLGEKSGQGVMRHANGILDEGEWKNDKMYNGTIITNTPLGEAKIIYGLGKPTKASFLNAKTGGWRFEGLFCEDNLPLAGYIKKGEFKIELVNTMGKYTGILFYENGTNETKDAPSPKDSKNFNNWVITSFVDIDIINRKNKSELERKQKEYEQQKAKEKAKQKAREEEIKWNKAATQIPYYIWDASTIRSIYENNPARFRTLTQYKYIIFDSTITDIEESDEMEYSTIYQDYIRYKLYTVRLSGGVYLETTDANFVSNLYIGQKAYFVGYYTDKKSYGRTLFTFEMCASSHDGLIGLMKKRGISLDYFVKRINY